MPQSLIPLLSCQVFEKVLLLLLLLLLLSLLSLLSLLLLLLLLLLQNICFTGLLRGKCGSAAFMHT